jgi:hypothetical protein
MPLSVGLLVGQSVSHSVVRTAIISSMCKTNVIFCLKDVIATPMNEPTTISALPVAATRAREFNRC